MKGKWKRLSLEVRALLVMVGFISVATLAWATFRGDLLTHAAITFDYANPSTTSIEGNLVVKGTLSVYDEFTSVGPIVLMPNGEEIANRVDAEVTLTADDNTSDQLILTLRNTTATTNDTDEIIIRAMMDDDELDEDGFGQISFTADDASSGSEDGSIVFTTITAGTSATAATIDGAGIALANGEKLGNTAVDGEVTLTGDDNTSDQLILTLRNVTATTDDTDEIKIRAAMADDTTVEQIYGELSFTADDATAASEDASLVTTLITGGTSVTAMTVTGNSTDIPSSLTVQDVQIFDMLNLWNSNGVRMDASSMGLSGTSYTIKGVYLPTALSLTGSSVSITGLSGTWDANDLIIYSPSMVLSGTTVYQVVAKNELGVIDFYTSPTGGAPGGSVTLNILLIDK